MKKNERGGPWRLTTLFAKTLLLMKLTILLVCVFSIPSFANNGFGQEKISLNLEGATLKRAFKAIEKQTGFRFVYNDDLLPAGRNITISAQREPLEMIMKKLLDRTSLGYRKLGKSLVIISNNLDISSSDYSLDVSGKVTGTDGAPIAGISVVERGTNNGTTTGSDGSFSITVTDGNAVLVFSSVGFATLEVGVNNRAVVNVTLELEQTKLNEVVVVGYGTQRKREVTSAVASLDAEEFNKGNINDVSQLLQGKVAGLSIARPGGDPNGSFTIRLRGLSTLGANTQPLVVIDGQVGADLNTIDPNDIQSVDILKDGSAAAIYGTRGSQGVIIITTKKGTRGDSQISYSSYVTAESAAKFTPHMTAAEFKALGKGTDYGANTDWNEEITRTGISHTHNISFSGGNGSQSSYNASVNFRNAEGVAITTGFQQLNGRLNLMQKALKNKLVFNLNVSTTRRKSNLGFREAFKYATIYNPTSPVYSSDPSFDLSGGGFFEQNFIDYANPVAVLTQNRNNQEVKRLNMAASAEYEIISGLKFLARYAQQNISTYDQAYLPRTSFFNRAVLGTVGNLSGFSRGGYGYKQDAEAFNQLYENTLSYDTRLNDFMFSAIAGYSYQYFLNQGVSAAGGNFITDASADNLGSALDFAAGLGTITSYKNASKLIAFFGRVNLNYNNVAFLSASLRREGSTQFGENNKWGMFPAVSAGVDISRLVDVAEINNLKLRASYGVTGSLPPSAYLSLQRLSTTGSYFYTGGGQYLQSYAPSQNDNPDLKWERKTEIDVGVDFSLLNNRLSGTIDYYNRTTSDLLFNVTVPVPPNAANNTWKNVGELKSNGIELSVTYDVFRDREFTWSTTPNFSTYNVELTELNVDASFVGATNLGTPGQEATQITRAVEGEKIGILWGPIFRGVNKSGQYLFDNGSGDTTTSTDYKTIIGNGLPDFEFGWSNSFTYKNFDFNFFLRGSIGHDLINTFRAFYENPNVATSYNIINTKYLNTAVTDGQIFSSLFVEKASFVKLDNATIGYNFNLPKSGVIRNLRAYISGQNLFVITDYTGVDPEVRYLDPAVGATPANVLAPGVDRRETWVRTRSFTLGVNVGF